MRTSEAIGYGIIGSIVAFLISGALCVALGQDTSRVSTDVTIVNNGDGTHTYSNVYGQNYFDTPSGKFKPRNIAFKNSETLPHKIVYREGHNVVLDTLTGYVNLNINGEYVVFTPINPDNPKAIKNKTKVKYKTLWHDVDYDVQLLPDGTKETITLLNKNAPTTFQFQSEFSKPPQIREDGLLVGNMLVAAPTALDAVNTFRTVDWQVSAPKDGYYTYTMTLDTAGLVYPIAIDPSISIVDTASMRTTFINENAPTTAYGSETYIIAGNGAPPNTEKEFDTYLYFDVSSIPAGSRLLTVTCSLRTVSAKIYINAPTQAMKLMGVLKNTETWAENITFNTKPDSTLTDSMRWLPDTGAVDNWSTITSSDTTYGIAKWLNNWINGGANYGFVIQKIEATPTQEVQYAFYSKRNAAASVPRLYVSYVSSGLKRPYGVSFKTPAPDSTGLIFSDTSSIATYAILKNGSHVTLDSVYIPTTTTTLLDTLWHTGLTANLKDTLYISMRDSSSNDTLNSIVKSGYTKANTPSPPSFGGFTATTFDLTINANSNPAITHFSVWDSTWRRWLKSNGDTTKQSDTTWTTKADWDGTTITGRSRFTTYKFGVYGRNGDSVVTAFSGLTQTNSLLDSMQIIPLDTNKFRMYADLDTFDLGDSIRFYVYKTGTTDTVWGDYLNYASTLVSDTITVTTGPNVLYFGGVRIVQASSGPHYYTPIDSARGLSMKIQSASITWTNDTTFTLTITDTRNPANTGYFLLDSVRVDSSLAPYLSSDSVGYFNTKVYSSKAKLELPIRIPRTQITAGQTMRLRIITSNRDSTGTGIP